MSLDPYYNQKAGWTWKASAVSKQLEKLILCMYLRIRSGAIF
jgi:hypothetical protein